MASQWPLAPTQAPNENFQLAVFGAMSRLAKDSTLCLTLGMVGHLSVVYTDVMPKSTDMVMVVAFEMKLPWSETFEKGEEGVKKIWREEKGSDTLPA